MPVFFYKTLPIARYAVWYIQEDAAFFLENLPATFLKFEKEYVQITHNKIKLQWLASRYLWYKIAGEQADFCLEKSAFGKPFLKNSPLQYSISHSGDFVAIVEAAAPCGIDIQMATDTIDRIAHRIMHENDWRELEKHSLDTTLFWSAKEAIFKAWEKGGLAGKNIRLHGFDKPSEAHGSVVLQEKKQKEYALFYEKTPEFTLAIALETPVL
ncbi:MAG: hypothetical protein RI894_1088 [Bacteroidota bacterium]|jgi:phosphopantetheinyl transferase